jgi:hypothetical protein
VRRLSSFEPAQDQPRGLVAAALVEALGVVPGDDADDGIPDTPALELGLDGVEERRSDAATSGRRLHPERLELRDRRPTSQVSVHSEPAGSWIATIA